MATDNYLPRILRQNAILLAGPALLAAGERVSSNDQEDRLFPWVLVTLVVALLLLANLLGALLRWPAARRWAHLLCVLLLAGIWWNTAWLLFY